jgi:hypothetical protein
LRRVQSACRPPCVRGSWRAWFAVPGVAVRCGVLVPRPRRSVVRVVRALACVRGVAPLSGCPGRCPGGSRRWPSVLLALRLLRCCPRGASSLRGLGSDPQFRFSLNVGTLYCLGVSKDSVTFVATARSGTIRSGTSRTRTRTSGRSRCRGVFNTELSLADTPEKPTATPTPNFPRPPIYSPAKPTPEQSRSTCRRQARCRLGRRSHACPARRRSGKRPTPRGDRTRANKCSLGNSLATSPPESPPGGDP